MDDPVARCTTDPAAPTIVQPAVAPGARVADRYRLETRLGTGGGGTVWRCTDEKLASTVALKILGSDGDVGRWRREVAMARRIADRNVCRVYDLGEADGLRYVTMELVEGTGLRAKLGARLALAEARDLLAQIVAGAAAIHAAGVVHRDLKPDNVVVASDGRAVIVDFGLAREHHDSQSLTHAGTVVGTPRYMSPEQAAGATVDARTDVWALGLIAHELLTGKLPEADGATRVIDVAALAAWPAIIPVLRRCLAPAATNRFADARALRDALVRARRRRAPVLALACGGVAVAATVATVWAWPSADPPRPRVRVAPLATAATPFSAALAPDAAVYAYTTTDARLLVQPLAGGAPSEWKLPTIAYRAPGETPRDIALVTAWAVGWFGDRSVAVVAISAAGTWHLLRIHGDGRHALLYSAADRFTAAAAGEVAVIGAHENAIYLVDPAHPDDLEAITPLGTGEIAMAVSVSPDARHVAVARLPPGSDDATIQVMTLRGDDIKLAWRGRVRNDVDQVLGWLDDHRLAFVHRAETATLYVHDLRDKSTTLRHRWAAEQYVGIGSAAHGQLLVVGGRTQVAVAIGGAHDPEPRIVRDAMRPAGWTADGRVVLAMRDRVVRASTAGAIDDWPGLAAGEVPNTLVDGDVIVHRRDASQTVIERVAPAGARRELVRIPPVDARYLVRCAGDRTTPCVLEDAAKGMVTWRELDPVTGALGGIVHKRLRRERFMQTAALSADGATLAIVEGTSELVLVDRATGTARTLDIGNGAELQTVGFAADGALWMTALGHRGHFFATLVLPAGASEARDVWHGASRFFWRPTPSPDGAQVAVQVLDFALELSHVTGL